MQQFLVKETAEQGGIHIAVDSREDDKFVQMLRAMGATVAKKVLEVGDFICSHRLAVERKTRADFEQSVMDGRLFAQLQNMAANYERNVVIIEGTVDEGRLNRGPLLGAYSSIMADFGASVIFTRNKESTAELIFHIAKHEQLAKRQQMRIYAKRKSLTPSQSARAVVETLPSVGPKLAKALLLHFGTIEQLAKASERDLAEVPGLGKKKAKIIRNLVAYSYLPDQDRSMY